ncbi:protein of unknown function [Rhodovastum atsumiense]|nr:protein of unknown function [Rhodovastum atsumiense]
MGYAPYVKDGYETINCDTLGMAVPISCADMCAFSRHRRENQPECILFDCGTVIAVKFFDCGETRPLKEHA